MSTLGRFSTARRLVPNKPCFAGVDPSPAPPSSLPAQTTTESDASVAPNDQQEDSSELEEESSSLINVNTADKDQLTQLPGIGDVSAQAIINHRPYTALADLIANSGVTRLSQEDWEAIEEFIAF